MLYIARAAVELRGNHRNYTDSWHKIKKEKGIEYRWRLKDNTYEVIAGLYEDKREALNEAKRMYVTLLYTLLKKGFQLEDSGCNTYYQRFYDEDKDETRDNFEENENFFFWDKKYMGGRVGPGVFEVTTSLMEMNDYHFYKATLEIVYPESIFEFDNADEYVFTYCRDAQEYLNVIVNADNIGSVGAKMQLLCGLLERLAPRYEKEASVLEEINLLVDHIDKSGISDSRKEQLCNYIKAARWESSRRRCNDLCKRYAKKKYGKYNTKRIVNEAYSIRSAYAHGKIIDAYNKEAAPYIKYVVLDVLMNYFREKEMNKELD